MCSMIDELVPIFSEDQRKVIRELEGKMARRLRWLEPRKADQLDEALRSMVDVLRTENGALSAKH